jgi:GTP-binding protein
MIDLVKLKVKAGDGGNGCVAFHRAKYIPYGGPSGGDGGDGGSIYFEVDTNETTLAELRYEKMIKAGTGGAGMNKQSDGRKGDDVTIKVPLGTMIRNADTGDLMADMTKPHQKVMIAKGGKGGKGNWHFANGRNDAPEFAEPGGIGDAYNLRLELKLLADAGIIGFPSVGKSTFLSVVSQARPAIAAYPFTTLEPNIGVVALPDSRSFVMADMPGLIEGASQGKGLGYEFLRHIDRCRVLIHMLDMGEQDRDPVEDYRIINDELRSYNEQLAKKPQIVVANKMDEAAAQDNLKRFEQAYPDLKVYELSAKMHRGLDPVLYAVMEQITAAKKKEEEAVPEISAETVVYRYEPKKPDFRIVPLGSHRWSVESQKVSRLADAVDFNKEDETYRFGMTLKKMGIDKALREAGARYGDHVIVGKYDMTWEE